MRERVERVAGHDTPIADMIEHTLAEPNEIIGRPVILERRVTLGANGWTVAECLWMQPAEFLVDDGMRLDSDFVENIVWTGHPKGTSTWHARDRTN